VLSGAVNDDANIPDFVQQFKPAFPVGTAKTQAALQYMQWPPDKRPLVPFMAFIDRKGMIRAQVTGVDGEFFGPQEEKNIRERVEKLLAEPNAVKSKPKKH